MRIAVMILALAALSAGASAQSVAVSQPLKDDGKVVTVKLTFEKAADDFTARKCSWFSTRGQLALIHEGCDSFSREFVEGFHTIVLVVDGRSSSSTWNEQRSKTVEIRIQPRVLVTNHNFDPEQFRAK